MPIRTACKADLEALVVLFSDYLAFYETTRLAAEVRDFVAARLQRHDSHILLSEGQDGQLLGFVQLYPFFASLALRPAWLLSDLYVSPRARRQGVGEALMNAARDHALTTGACGLQLETARGNLTAQTLYERLGYVRDEVFYTYWLALD